MAKVVSEKECVLCSKKMFNVDVATRYCPDCKKVVTNENHKRCRNLNPQKARSEESYGENLNKIADEPFKLTPKYFNEHSQISVKSYANYFRTSWPEILKLFNRFDELYNYIVTEYKNFTNNHPKSKQGFLSFEQNHEYITKDLIKNIGFDEIRKDAGVRRLRYSDEDLMKNINDLKLSLNRMPLYMEFKNISSITTKVYQKRLGLKNESYDEIIKFYSTDDEYKEYLNNKKLHKSKVGAETGKLSAIHTDEDYENEFRRVFEYCLNEFKTMPSNDLFNELSKINERSYRKKYKKSWTEVCKMYGYEIDRTANKAEKTTLEIVKTIINEEYIPQQTFEWLKGINEFPLYCDGYFPNHKLIIEFDGKQHREPVDNYGGLESFKVLQANDKCKDRLIPENGLKLIRISSEEPFWNKDYIENKLIEYNII